MLVPDNTEIWRSINGDAFALIDTVPGSPQQFVDTDGMSAGDIWCYKVRNLAGNLTSSFSNEGCAVNQYTGTETGVVSHPTWMLAFGNFVPADSDFVTSLNLSGLLSVSGIYSGDGTQLMTNLNLASLIHVGADLNLDNSVMLPSISLPSLVSIGGAFHCDGSDALTSLSVPAFVGPATGMFCDDCTLLASVSVPSLIMRNGKSYTFDQDALLAASVNAILARGIASGVTSATITLDNGTNAAPSGQGVADKAILIGLGNTVSTN